MMQGLKSGALAFIGDLTVDYYPKLNKKHLGGSSLNSAIWALRSGTDRVSIVAAVGDDEVGTAYLRKMRELGIEDAGVSVFRGITSNIEIFVDRSTGERQWGNWEAGVLGRYHLGDKAFDHLRVQSAASLTIYGKTAHLLTELSDWGRNEERKPFLAVNFDDLSQFTRSINVVEKHIDGIDAAFFGLDKEADEEIIKDISALSRDTGKLMIVTIGKYGAVAFQGGNELLSPAYTVENVIDTTGAGDAFLAGFIVCYMKTNDVQASLAVGNNIASQKIQILGAY